MNVTVEIQGPGYVWCPELGVTRKIRDNENAVQAKEALAAELRQRSEVSSVTVK